MNSKKSTKPKLINNEDRLRLKALNSQSDSPNNDNNQNNTNNQKPVSVQQLGNISPLKVANVSGVLTTEQIIQQMRQQRALELQLHPTSPPKSSKNSNKKTNTNAKASKMEMDIDSDGDPPKKPPPDHPEILNPLKKALLRFLGSVGYSGMENCNAAALLLYLQEYYEDTNNVKASEPPSFTVDGKLWTQKEVKQIMSDFWIEKAEKDKEMEAAKAELMKKRQQQLELDRQMYNID
jgi:hypothetical protein